MTVSRRRGKVTGFSLTDPGVVLATVGGGAVEGELPFVDGYTPRAGDDVNVLAGDGAPLILGKTAPGPTRVAAGAVTANVSGITTTPGVVVATTPDLTVGANGSDVRVGWAWDSVQSATAGDRLGLRLQEQVNGGAWAQVARTLIRVPVANNAGDGGSSFTLRQSLPAGTYAYRVLAIIEAGTGAGQINASAIAPFTLTAERWT